MSNTPVLWPKEELLSYFSPKPMLPEGVDSSTVPDAIKPLIDYAEVWGSFMEEAGRNRAIRQVDPAALANLIEAVKRFEPSLTEWLAGEAADDEVPSQAYIRFTNLVMAADYAALVLSRP
jgi:hypothetical protein